MRSARVRFCPNALFVRAAADQNNPQPKAGPPLNSHASATTARRETTLLNGGRHISRKPDMIMGRQHAKMSRHDPQACKEAGALRPEQGAGDEVRL